ncbi:MAG: hypothetical protein KGL32_08060, partial [candidate division NC10 bacterium]|nr:hypothetical protein [candidate division NC10 bacterium]
MGSITVRVEHTNQVWAAEVLRLFEEHIGKIVILYSLAYKTLRSLKSFGILDTIAIACVVLIIAGGIYMHAQRKDLLNPLKVRDEFIFDVAEVLIDNRSDRDPSLLLQFFLLRDLKYEPRAVVSSLQEAGRFNSKYHGVIDKWVSGYYDRDEKSEKLSYGAKALIQQIRAMQNIHWAYSYFRFVLLYLV